MRKITVGFVMLGLGIVAIGQVPEIGYVKYWPALYEAANDLYCKRGVDAEGNETDKVYCRLDWSPCIELGRDGWTTFVDGLSPARFERARDYADSVYYVPEPGGLEANCPRPPREVKPYWYGSRPLYSIVVEMHGDGSYSWRKGKRTDERVVASDPAVIDCDPYRMPDADGDPTSYSPVWINEHWYAVVCQDKDISVGDYQF